MIGFLTPYFSEIDIVDPRYYSSDLDMQIAVNQYTDLLILYNLQSFAKDSSLAFDFHSGPNPVFLPVLALQPVFAPLSASVLPAHLPHQALILCLSFPPDSLPLL